MKSKKKYILSKNIKKTPKKIQLFKDILNKKNIDDAKETYLPTSGIVDSNVPKITYMQQKPKKLKKLKKKGFTIKLFKPSFSKLLKSPHKNRSAKKRKTNKKRKTSKKRKTTKEINYSTDLKFYNDIKKGSDYFIKIPYSLDKVLLTNVNLMDNKFKKKNRILHKDGTKNIKDDLESEEIGHGMETLLDLTST